MKGKGMLDGEVIKRLRKARGMSLAGLAKAIGVSRGFIYLLERGETGISFENAQRMAKALGIDLAVLSQNTSFTQVENTPSWLAYLISKYNLSDNDRDLLVKFVRDAGLDDDQEDETGEAFKSRWDSFYKTVCAFLPNPIQRFFADAEVRQFLVVMGVDGIVSWRELRRMFVEKLKDRVPTAECVNGECWRRHIESVLGIETLRIDDTKDIATLFVNRPDISEPSIMGGVALVTSSSRMLGAVYRHSSGKFVLVEDCRGEKAKQRDFAFWHEATRVLIDPELRLGRGVKCMPDGLERTPIERLICRLAVWFAFGFVTEASARDVLRGGEASLVDAVATFRDKNYPQATLRMAMAAIIDSQDASMLYVDSYLRLKHPEQIAKGIRIEEVEKMRNDPDAKLRIAYVYANIAAEEKGLELRSGMRIGKKSPIYKAFKSRKSTKGEENLADWDYDLSGHVVTETTLSSDGHIRALVIQGESAQKGKHLSAVDSEEVGNEQDSHS